MTTSNIMFERARTNIVLKRRVDGCFVSWHKVGLCADLIVQANPYWSPTHAGNQIQPRSAVTCMTHSSVFNATRFSSILNSCRSNRRNRNTGFNKSNIQVQLRSVVHFTCLNIHLMQRCDDSEGFHMDKCSWFQLQTMPAIQNFAWSWKQRYSSDTVLVSRLMVNYLTYTNTHKTDKVLVTLRRINETIVAVEKQ